MYLFPTCSLDAIVNQAPFLIYRCSGGGWVQDMVGLFRCNCPGGAGDLQRQDLSGRCWELKSLALARGPSIRPFPLCCISIPASAQLLSHKPCPFGDAPRDRQCGASTMIRTASLQKAFSHCSSLSGGTSRSPACLCSIVLLYTNTRANCVPCLKHGRSQD